MEERFYKVKIFGVFVMAALMVVSVFGFGIPASAASASLVLSPASGNVDVGDSFSVNVVVSSPDTLINAAQGAVIYPADVLQIDSISKGSFVNFWAREPAFSNVTGTVNFEGVILNGWQGSNAVVLTLNFRAVSTGDATIRLSSGAVLAHDGLGTNIVSFLGLSSFKVGGGAPVVEEDVNDVDDEVVDDEDSDEEGVEDDVSESDSSKEDDSLVVSAPVVTSSTHPDPSKWYALNDVQLSWELLDEITGVNILADHDADSDLGLSSDGLFSTYVYEDVDDGEWFLHIRNISGASGSSVVNFGFNIDTVDPEKLEIIKNVDERGVLSFEFIGHDALSGIEKFDVSIDDGEFFEILAEDEAASYLPSGLGRGDHTIKVIGYDRALNEIEKSLSFYADGLITPLITRHSFEWSKSEPFFVEGEATANSAVWLYMKKEDNEPLIIKLAADDNGRFSHESFEKIEDGVYLVWAQTVSANGMFSEKSVSFPYSVNSNFLVDNLMYVLIGLGLFLLLLWLFIAWRQRRRIVCIMEDFDKKSSGSGDSRVIRVKRARKTGKKTAGKKTGGRKAGIGKVSGAGKTGSVVGATVASRRTSGSRKVASKKKASVNRKAATGAKKAVKKTGGSVKKSKSLKTRKKVVRKSVSKKKITSSKKSTIKKNIRVKK